MNVLTREQVRELDRRAIDEFGVPGVVLMENAGRGVVDVMLELGVAGKVVVCCGRGNNAGDGFVIARRLDLLGKPVRVLRWSPSEKLRGDAAVNFAILGRAGLAGRLVEDVDSLPAELSGAEWIVDALLGTGATGAPRAPLDAVLPVLNASPARRMAIDLPSGVDANTGDVAGAVFRADHTCTFVAAKPGLLQPGAREFVGQLHVVDIGAPRKLIEQMFVA